jgi:leucyl-tRNA synthetase
LSKALQREWIGRSTGSDVSFSVVDDPAGTVLTAFTTRVDTVFGATYIAIAPEHPYVDMAVQRASNGREVASYVS